MKRLFILLLLTGFAPLLKAQFNASDNHTPPPLPPPQTGFHIPNPAIEHGFVTDYPVNSDINSSGTPCPPRVKKLGVLDWMVTKQDFIYKDRNDVSLAGKLNLNTILQIVSNIEIAGKCSYFCDNFTISPQYVDIPAYPSNDEINNANKNPGLYQIPADYHKTISKTVEVSVTGCDGKSLSKVIKLKFKFYQTDMR